MQNKVKLSKWAESNGKEYKEAWNMVQNGTFPEKITRNSKGSIFVLQETKATKDKKVEFALPAFADLTEKRESLASSRRNRAATSNRTDEYYWIENGVDPINSNGRGSKGKNDCLDATESIRLVRLAYTNFSELRNIINAMVEFSSAPIYWSGGNAKSRKFFEALFNKVGIDNLQDKFFLEYYRSCNVIPYRLESVIKDEDLTNLNKAFGTTAAKKIKLPVKYIILNPENVIAGGNITFSDSAFYQRLNTYEVQRLVKPVTKEDKDLLNAMPDEIKTELKNFKNKHGAAPTIDIPLKSDYCYFIFYKKMDYESLATPLAWPVLRDLNWKAELKSIDMAVARTTQRAILMITMGFENKNGDYMFDAKAAEAMRQLFESESVGKVLVGDFTTKGEWLIPEVDKILGQEKYKQVNEDIKNGLNNILSGGGDEKFANQSIKVKLFVQRLKQSRETFLNEFLIPEVKRISKDMGFKSYPTPTFADIDLKDEDLFARILAQLAGIGYLTPEELFEAMSSGRLPTREESEESQRQFKLLKDEGLYQTPQNNPSPQLETLTEQQKQQIKVLEKQHEFDSKEKQRDRQFNKDNPQAPAPQIVLNAPTKMGQPKGKPAGSKSPNTKKKTKPISASLMAENLAIAAQLNKKLHKELCDKYKLKELTPIQDELAGSLLENIMCGEEPKNWLKSTTKYLKNPDYLNREKLEEVREFGEEMELNDYSAAIAYNSQRGDSAT